LPVPKRLFWFLAVVTLLRLAYSTFVELSLDEAYYWHWSRYLQSSYFDHPPMVAYVIALTTLFSDSVFFVRLGAVLGAAVASWLFYRLTIELFDNDEAGFRAAVISNLIAIFAVGAFVVTPDTPLIPFYLASLIAFHAAAKKEAGEPGGYGRWVFAGAIMGLALLSKYTAAFFYPSAFLYLLLSPERRGWLLKPHPYVAAITSLLVFSPVIAWNAKRDWASFAFQFGHGMSKREVEPFYLFAEFFSFQIFIYSFGIFFFMLASFFTLFKKSFALGSNPLMTDKFRDACRFLFSFTFPILLFFFVNSFRSRVEGNWPVLGFLPLIVSTAVLVPGWYLKDWTRRFINISGWVAILLVLFLHVQIAAPVIKHPGRKEISIRTYGFGLLGDRVDALWKEEPADFILGNRYQIASLMSYNTEPHKESHVVYENSTRYFFAPGYDSLEGKNAVYVTEETRDISKKLAKMFERIEKADSIDINRHGEFIKRFIFYRCYNYTGGFR
jgi:4-amino-4-deoxy-L-arabinose transferase-like glycosyltransferase